MGEILEYTTAKNFVNEGGFDSSFWNKPLIPKIRKQK